MNPEEKQLLGRFLDQLVEVPQIPKDREAAAMIEAAFERQPNAAYLVVQRALLLQEALETSQAEVARLRAEAPPPRQQAASSFLGADAWGRRAEPRLAASRPVPRAGAGMGSLLGQAAAVAAGVAGGAFLFQGINELFGTDAPGAPAAGDAHQLTDSSWGDAGPDMDAGFDAGDFLA